MKLTPEVVGKAVSGLGTILDGAVGLLPAKWATKVREGRKAIVTAAGGAMTLLAALNALPLPPSVAPWVAAGMLITTAIVTWWTPNAEPG